jgi:hypothetical protein
MSGMDTTPDLPQAVRHGRRVPQADLGNYQATHLRFRTLTCVLAVNDADGELVREPREAYGVRTAYWR